MAPETRLVLRSSLKLQTMALAELELKSPSIPLFSKGDFHERFPPLFEKEGKGDFPMK
jgi:hypothetical protein